jgi:hypothetical protein
MTFVFETTKIQDRRGQGLLLGGPGDHASRPVIPTAKLLQLAGPYRGEARSEDIAFGCPTEGSLSSGGRCNTRDK